MMMVSIAALIMLWTLKAPMSYFIIIILCVILDVMIGALIRKK